MDERQYGDEPIPATGEATLDLSRRIPSPEHPAVAEARIRARSRHLIIGGSVLTATTVVIATIWHIGFGTFMPAVYAIPVYAASCGAILLGCLEYITRHSREQQAQALGIALRVQADQLRLVDLLDEELKQRYFVGCADAIRDQVGMMRTGTTGHTTGRAPVPANRSGGDVVELRRRTANDSHF